MEPMVQQTNSEAPKEVQTMAKQLVQLSQSKEQENPTTDKKEAVAKADQPGGSVEEVAEVEEATQYLRGWRALVTLSFVTICDSLDLKNKIPPTWEREANNLWEKHVAKYYKACVKKYLPLLCSKGFLAFLCIFYGGCFPRIATTYFAMELSGTSLFVTSVDTFLMSLPFDKGFKAIYTDIMSRKNGPQDINGLLGNFAVQYAILSFVLSTSYAQALCLGICISMMIQAYHSTELNTYILPEILQKVNKLGEKFDVQVGKQWIEFALVHGLAWLFSFFAYFAPTFITALAVGIYGTNLYKMEYSYLVLVFGVGWQVWKNYQIGYVTSAILSPLFVVNRMIK